jgi:hypothetical protein
MVYTYSFSAVKNPINRLGNNIQQGRQDVTMWAKMYAQNGSKREYRASDVRLQTISVFGHAVSNTDVVNGIADSKVPIKLIDDTQ